MIKKGGSFLAWALIFVLLFSVAVSAQQKTEAQKSIFKYVGATKCKPCHQGEKKGKQWEIWSESKHSKAYETLATEESKKVAQKVGVKEEPQKAEKCLKCHITAYGVAAELKEPTYKIEEGISCEACHGPGSVYKSMKIMKDIAAGTQKPEEVGMFKITEKLCLACHNPESPTYKPFKFTEDMKKIAHPAPKAETK